jgi:hypothetical protein
MASSRKRSSALLIAMSPRETTIQENLVGIPTELIKNWILENIPAGAAGPAAQDVIAPLERMDIIKFLDIANQKGQDLTDLFLSTGQGFRPLPPPAGPMAPAEKKRYVVAPQSVAMRRGVSDEEYKRLLRASAEAAARGAEEKTGLFGRTRMKRPEIRWIITVTLKGDKKEIAVSPDQSPFEILFELTPDVESVKRFSIDNGTFHLMDREEAYESISTLGATQGSTIDYYTR